MDLQIGLQYVLTVSIIVRLSKYLKCRLVEMNLCVKHYFALFQLLYNPDFHNQKQNSLEEISDKM